MYNNGYYELYHYGVKGQKHGDRRYQNPDGSLTPEGYEHYGYGHGRRAEKKYAKNFDYKTTEKYRNASPIEKRKMIFAHDRAELWLGKKGANKVDYKAYVKGKDRKKETRKAVIKTAAIGTALGIGLLAAPALASKGGEAISRFKRNLSWNNVAADIYGVDMHNLNTVHKRGLASPKSIINAAKRGKKFVNVAHVPGAYF